MEPGQRPKNDERGGGGGGNNFGIPKDDDDYEQTEEEENVVSLGGPEALRSYYVTSPDTRSGTT